MADKRFKNATFDLSNAEGRCASWDHATLAALYDIRDELQRLNQTLACPRFLAIPTTLERIEKNTKKRRKPRAVGKPALRVVSR